jgi:hypothetical protein
MAPENATKNFGAIQLSDKNLSSFWDVTQVWLAWPSHHQVGIPQQSQGKRPPYIRVKIQKQSKIRIKVMALLSRYSSLAD